MRSKNISISKLVFVCVIAFSFIPNFGFKFSTVGFTWTAYRLTMVLSIAIFFGTGGIVHITYENPISKWIIFMLFWSVYGFMLLFIGEYSDTHNGFVEWLSIFLGLMAFCILKITLLSSEDRDLAIKLIYWLLNLMIIVGFIEIVTGKHMMTSAYCDETSSVYWYSNVHMATGFMYNMNDFSAMITCMSPVLIDRKLGKKRIITFIGVVAINLINDATTCTLAVVMFALYYFLMLKGGKSQRTFLIKIFFWIILFSSIFFAVVLGIDFTGKSGFLGALARQISNAQKGMGSLYARIIMYKDAIKAFISTGMIGLGPRGFSRYFEINKSLSGLVNPHSLVLEILSQYGIIVGVWFISLLVWMFRSARRAYDLEEELKERAIMVIAFVIIYFIASFASSSFIGYAYQWIMIAVMCSQLNNLIDIGGIVNA